ncbi:MAG: type IV secretory system conjugative DNA transfer family protein [Alphaproteobacteria bacterium]|nr:type IV secretory system conjugative DNA transfer family protein [Alphaproteobacteria bacterium]
MEALAGEAAMMARISSVWLGMSVMLLAAYNVLDVAAAHDEGWAVAALDVWPVAITTTIGLSIGALGRRASADLHQGLMRLVGAALVVWSLAVAVETTALVGRDAARAWSEAWTAAKAMGEWVETRPSKADPWRSRFKPAPAWDRAKVAWRDAAPDLVRLGQWSAIVLVLGLGVLIGRQGLIVEPVRLVWSGRRRTSMGPWAAAMMSDGELSQLRRVPAGLPLGRLPSALPWGLGPVARYKPDPERGWLGGHHAVIAGTRAGKGVSCVLPAILEHDGPVVVNDIKGELMAMCARHRRSLGRRVILLNPFGHVTSETAQFNPLAYCQPESLYDDAKQIAAAIVVDEGDGDGKHFVEIARTLVAATIEVSLRHLKPEMHNLPAIAGLLTGGDRIAMFKAWVKDPATWGDRAARAAAAVLDVGKKERGSFFTTLKRAFDWLESDQMQRFLTPRLDSKGRPIPDFDLDDLLEDQIDIFIVVPLIRLEDQQRFLRLATNLALATILRASGRREPKKRVLLVADEMPRLGRLETLLQVATVAAGSGIDMLFAAQDLGGLIDVWGEEATGTLLGSCATVRAFGLGRTDKVTAQWLESMIGHETVMTANSNRGAFQVIGGRFGAAEQKDRLLTADQIAELPPDEMIVFFRSRPLARFKHIVSWRETPYAAQLDPNPTLVQ